MKILGVCFLVVGIPTAVIIIFVGIAQGNLKFQSQADRAAYLVDCGDYGDFSR